MVIKKLIIFSTLLKCRYLLAVQTTSSTYLYLYAAFSNESLTNFILLIAILPYFQNCVVSFFLLSILYWAILVSQFIPHFLGLFNSFSRLEINSFMQESWSISFEFVIKCFSWKVFESYSNFCCQHSSQKVVTKLKKPAKSMILIHL